MKRVPFVINSKYNWYKKGVPFLSKMVYITERDEGLDLREEPPRIKRCRVASPSRGWNRLLTVSGEMGNGR